MKKIIGIAALATFATLAACAKPAPTEEATPAATEAAATETAAMTLAADGKPSVGSYKVTDADGKTVMEEVKADGTYIDTVDGKVVETGKWEQKAPETYCYTKDAADAKQVCNTEGVDDKGVWTSKNPDTGAVATVERIDGAS